MPRSTRLAPALALACALAAVAACGGEGASDAGSSGQSGGRAEDQGQGGGTAVARTAGVEGGQREGGHAPDPYAGDEVAIAEGKRLFRWYNCAACHGGAGGGGMGPPFADEEWLYGSSPEAIRESIVNGRPGGMPSFRGKIVEEEIAKLITYVRSLSPATSSSGSQGGRTRGGSSE